MEEIGNNWGFSLTTYTSNISIYATHIQIKHTYIYDMNQICPSYIYIYILYYIYKQDQPWKHILRKKLGQWIWWTLQKFDSRSTLIYKPIYEKYEIIQILDLIWWNSSKDERSKGRNGTDLSLTSMSGQIRADKSLDRHCHEICRWRRRERNAVMVEKRNMNEK